ncbi:hypothetical protein D3C72_1471680 [compost metagenome]
MPCRASTTARRYVRRGLPASWWCRTPSTAIPPQSAARYWKGCPIAISNWRKTSSSTAARLRARKTGRCSPILRRPCRTTSAFVPTFWAPPWRVTRSWRKAVSRTSCGPPSTWAATSWRRWCSKTRSRPTKPPSASSRPWMRPNTTCWCRWAWRSRRRLSVAFC